MERRINTKRLALAIARGETVKAWATRNKIPLRTAYRWSANPKVKLGVEDFRRRALNQALGKMAGMAMKAAEGIARLAQGAESESVQLRAWRAILADQMALTRFANLEQRMTEMEEQIRERD